MERNPVSNSSKQVVVDECLSEQAPLVQQFKTRRPDINERDFLFLQKTHRAIADADILSRILNRDTILLTTDRVLHNKTLEHGFVSFTLDKRGRLTCKKLPLKATPNFPTQTRSTGLKSDYAHPWNPIASAFKSGLPESAFKRYKTRRRRIRSYFASPENISTAALTIGARQTQRGFICGFFLALASYSGIKGFQATEGYAIGNRKEKHPAFPLLYALRDLYLLQLETTRTDLFILPSESLSLTQNLLLQLTDAQPDPAADGLRRCLLGLSTVTVYPCAKGRFFDAMQAKLEQMARFKSNELASIDFSSLVSIWQTRPSDVD